MLLAIGKVIHDFKKGERKRIVEISSFKVI